MLLDTNLKHVKDVQDFQNLISENENVMVCCGRMGPMCIPVYDIMENLESKYTKVAFRDMAFDDQVSATIRSLPEVREFMGLPFTVYFKNGKVVEATSSIQNKGQIISILEEKFDSD